MTIFLFRPPCFLPPQHDAKRTSNLRTEGLVQRRPQPVSPQNACHRGQPPFSLFYLKFSPSAPSGGSRRKVDALLKKAFFSPFISSSLRFSSHMDQVMRVIRVSWQNGKSCFGHSGWPFGLATGKEGRALRDLDLHCKSSWPCLCSPSRTPTHTSSGCTAAIILVERLILLAHRLPDHRNDK